jgi:hypothetical protein
MCLRRLWPLTMASVRQQEASLLARQQQSAQRPMGESRSVAVNKMQTLRGHVHTA